MRLKKIRLAGFKSFVDPTNIPFPGDMTAVVGPNGCGKSNVIDAVRWVLGESSAKNLRGDAMTDVIFNGSSARKPVSQCSVELVFDNTSGRIQGEFAAFNEISVKRVVTKEAVSSYFLNSSKCRRRDITDLFLGTGLGPRSYAIIEQGMISKLIESKPQDLRVFIEEAAGISKYKERRKETQNRIAHTKDNLLRLDDVRQELGDQIGKLKRQAAAATRYTELKQQERTLKAELATIKWLAQTKVMQTLAQSIDEKQLQLDGLAASQQGDESGLQALRNDQSVINQQIDDLQQQLFATGTEITKLEQSQLFAKKRLSQIQTEVEQLKQAESTHAQAIDIIDQELSSAESQLLDNTPQKEILEEQVFEVENRKYDIDEKLQAFNREHKQQDNAYHNKKQALQQKHSQIQQSLSLQQRLNTSIGELKDELQGLTSDELSMLILENKHALQKAQVECSQLQENLNAEIALQQDAQLALQQSRQKLTQLENELLEANSKLSALNSMHQDNQDDVALLNSFELNKAVLVWQHFKVQSGYEQALQSVLQSALQNIENAYVLPCSQQEIQQRALHTVSVNMPSILLAKAFTTQKRVNSLASFISNDKVPVFTNNILVCDTPEQGYEMLSDISPEQSVVCKNGIIINHHSIISPKQSNNAVLRQAQVDSLNEQIKQLQPIINTHKERVAEHETTCSNFENTITELNLAIKSVEAKLQTCTIEDKNLQYQQQQTSQRLTKINADIERQQTELEQEEMALELHNEQVEDLSIELAEFEQARESTTVKSEALQDQQQQIQQQYNQLQTKLHEHALLYQQLQNSVSVLQQQRASKQQLMTDNADKLAMLQEEAEDLLMPEHEQQSRLASLLEQQSTKRAEQAEKRLVLKDIETQISDIEKGQHGLTSKMNGVKSEIESLRIQSESASVRAQSYIEQLGEMSQSIKDILNTLDDNANEKTWQEDLDKTTASLSRLGAVNLAAVDEYEEQSLRKQHLDAQNDDLNSALETLENAMRKIDKETKSRFKSTFNQVNGDLQMLFPKVFGGGSAYLDLTGDDLLDTGVTIMARPPGKKNSTIHLLSGGEKALTALSLVFAIFRLNPAPFCLLDEVDAPLDDANVGRFCRLVSEMSQTVQFIYITHNKVAMEMATHLTGVTMAEPGVSRMVAVDMEQALAIAE